MWVIIPFLAGIVHAGSWFYGRERPDSWTVGGVWPLPQSIIYGGRNGSLHPDSLSVDAGDHFNCDVIRENVDHYMQHWMFPFPVKASATAPYTLKIIIKRPCNAGVPQHNFNEEYKLRVAPTLATIEAQEQWGAIRALETFSQLVFWNEQENEYQIRTAEVHDWPRFPVRGILLDTSRHFLSVKTIKRQLDLMSQSKMNMLHWHIVDSEAFPYTSERFPELHTVGAYSSRHVYSRRDVQDIIAYARTRAIRVMPEFDLPGHTSSWRGRKGFLTECYDASGKPTGLPNLVDPSKESNFKFIADFLEEKFLHLGGDEISDYLEECWTRNQKMIDFLAKKGLRNETRELENYFFERISKLVKDLKSRRDPVFWQEVFDNNKPDSSQVIHLWKGNTRAEVVEQVKNITSRGHAVIVSACWYLNYMKYGADWAQTVNGQVETNAEYYQCDPGAFDGSVEQHRLVLGGIATMWGELADGTNVEARLWPRASAVAERLWSDPAKTYSAKLAWPRLHELRCRQVARGYRVQPTYWPDYCPFEFQE